MFFFVLFCFSCFSIRNMTHMIYCSTRRGWLEVYSNEHLDKKIQCRGTPLTNGQLLDITKCIVIHVVANLFPQAWIQLKRLDWNSLRFPSFMKVLTISCGSISKVKEWWRCISASPVSLLHCTAYSSLYAAVQKMIFLVHTSLLAIHIQYAATSSHLGKHPRQQSWRDLANHRV